MSKRSCEAAESAIGVILRMARAERYVSLIQSAKQEKYLDNAYPMY
ncbi:MAG: hypothetical protein HDR05_07560 [Lachnospiraceae bacterium]|nr:hypothetical protein [Lachnospiraceae bacterium]